MHTFHLNTPTFYIHCACACVSPMHQCGADDTISCCALWNPATCQTAIACLRSALSSPRQRSPVPRIQHATVPCIMLACRAPEQTNNAGIAIGQSPESELVKHCDWNYRCIFLKLCFIDWCYMYSASASVDTTLAQSTQSTASSSGCTNTRKSSNFNIASSIAFISFTVAIPPTFA